MKDYLTYLKKLLNENKKYNTKNLYVCKLKFKNISNNSVLSGIFKVRIPLISYDVRLFEHLPSHKMYPINVNNDENIEVIEMIPFIEVYPNVFYPSLRKISSLVMDLKYTDEKQKILKK